MTLQPEGLCALIMGLFGVGVTTGVVSTTKGVLAGLSIFFLLFTLFALGVIVGKYLEDK